MPENIEQTAIGRQRKQRVKNLKKVILITLFLAIAVPLILCVFLLLKVNRLENQINNLQQELVGKNSSHDVNPIEHIEEVYQDELLADVLNIEDTEQLNISDSENNNDLLDDQIRKVYLTFDDGPSNNTDDILDILDSYGVKATFFVVGKEEEQFIPMYQRIVEEGHTLGMHSFSHKYKEIYDSVDAFSDDLMKLQDFLYDMTGVKCNLCRFPGGSSNTVSSVDMKDLIVYLKEQKITYYDWNISSRDASNGSLTTRQIADNVIYNIEDYNNAVVLMHDSTDKNTTLEALPIIIESILAMENTVILPITEDTIPVQHIKVE